MIGGALKTQPDMRLAGDSRAQRVGDSRLAYAGFAGQQHNLALALLRAPPVPQQQTDLLLAPDHRGQVRAPFGVETALRLARSSAHQARTGSSKTLQFVRAAVGVFECAARKIARGLRDHDAARFGESLQPGGEVERVADCRLLARRALADQIADHDQPGGDADARRQRPRRRGLQLADRRRDVEPGAHRPLGILLMRPRIAEEDQHAVAHELGDKAVIAGGDAGAGILVEADHLAHVLGIEPGGNRRRARQVAEHHRQLPSLGIPLLSWHDRFSQSTQTMLRALDGHGHPASGLISSRHASPPSSDSCRRPDATAARRCGRSGRFPGSASAPCPCRRGTRCSSP